MNLKKYYYLFLFLFCLSLPYKADASVTVSEIAWMGTPESANAEWIEFYNTSSEIVDMSGWKLYEAEGATLVYTFTKQIPGKTYFVLERTTPSIPDPLPDIDDESGSFGGSGLANAGEYLVLKNSQNQIVTELNASGGWPAGNASEKQTMQRSNGTWITALATPKAGPHTGTVEGNSETPSSSSQQTSSSGSSSQQKLEIKRSTASFIQIKFPEQVFLGQETAFDFSIFKDGYEWLAGYFYITMGDGTVYEFTKKTSLNHTYLHPGKYSVTVSFGENPLHEPLLIETVTVSVVDPSLVFSYENEFSGIILTYRGEGVIDIGGWKIVSEAGEYVFPRLSRMLSNTSTRIASTSVFSPTPHSPLSLVTKEGVTVASYKNAKTNNITDTRKVTQYNGTSTAVLSSPKQQQTDFSKKEDFIQPEERQQKNTKGFPIVFLVLLVVLISLFVYIERTTILKQEEEKE